VNETTSLKRQRSKARKRQRDLRQYRKDMGLVEAKVWLRPEHVSAVKQLEAQALQMLPARGSYTRMRGATPTIADPFGMQRIRLEGLTTTGSSEQVFEASSRTSAGTEPKREQRPSDPKEFAEWFIDRVMAHPSSEDSS